MISFETWLRKQKRRNDPVGDLARDYIDTSLWEYIKQGKKGKRQTVAESFKAYKPCKEVLITYKEAYEEYEMEVLVK